MQIKVQKLNESFSKITGPENDLRKIADRLKVEEPGAYFNPLVQRGFKSPFVYFTKHVNDSLIVYNGHLNLIGQKEDLKTDFSIEEIKDYLKNNLDGSVDVGIIAFMSTHFEFFSPILLFAYANFPLIAT